MDGRWSVTGGDLTPEWDVDGAAGTEDFRSVMRRAVGGLAVVTTLHEGRAWGMTVSAFSVVSVAPPTLLVCVGNGTVTADDAIRDGRFAVNLLSDAQVELSRLCARPGAAKYLDDHVLPAGALPRPVAMPVLPASLATFDCRLQEAKPVASHFVMIGSVLSILAPPPRPALLYGEGQYQRGVLLDAAAAAPAASPAGQVAFSE